MIIAYSDCTKRYRAGDKVVCDLCGKSVSSSGLKAHKNMHTLDKTIECEVTGCSKSFRTKEELKR